jgi:hypothetical protein
MLAAAGASLALAVGAPLTVTVLGLLLFGVLHNVLEIRYVAGRFAMLLTGRFLALLLALTSGIAVCRLTAASWPGGSRYAEVAIGYAILAAGCWIGLRGIALLAGLGVLALGAYASFSYPAYHFVVLTHLHNLVPLVSLWDWAGRIAAPRARQAFRMTQVLGFLAVLFLSDYFAGRALYGALATYHAYLEFPVLLALLMSPTTLRPGSRS